MGAGVVNAEQAAAWAAEGSYWARHDDRYNASVRAYTARLLAAAEVGDGDHVVDIGCGCGDTTRQAARSTGPAGGALGVDLSGPMIERARQRSREEGPPTARFEQADAQVYPFPPGRSDVAISRFGATFFADPVAAFVNVGHALRPGGRLALLAWQELSRNQWVGALRDALAAGRDLPVPAPGQPGMCGFASPDRARSVLSRAGFVPIAVEPVEEPVLLGRDGDDAFGFVAGMGITRGLLNGLDARTATTALTNLRTSLHAAASGAGVLLGSAAWLITATRP